jgi:hypothetical protein
MPQTGQVVRRNLDRRRCSQPGTALCTASPPRKADPDATVTVRVLQILGHHDPRIRCHVITGAGSRARRPRRR